MIAFVEFCKRCETQRDFAPYECDGLLSIWETFGRMAFTPLNIKGTSRVREGGLRCRSVSVRKYNILYVLLEPGLRRILLQMKYS